MAPQYFDNRTKQVQTIEVKKPLYTSKNPLSAINGLREMDSPRYHGINETMTERQKLGGRS